MSEWPKISMPKSLLRAFCLLMLSAGTCGASCTSRLDVKALSPASQSGSAAVPVAGASVYFDCPALIHKGRVRLGITDEQGIYRYEEWGGINIHDGCDIWVEKEGYAPQKFAVHDVCSRFVDDLARHCESVKLVVEMHKATGAPKSSEL